MQRGEEMAGAGYSFAIHGPKTLTAREFTEILEQERRLVKVRIEELYELSGNRAVHLGHTYEMLRHSDGVCLQHTTPGSCRVVDGNVPLVLREGQRCVFQ